MAVIAAPKVRIAPEQALALETVMNQRHGTLEQIPAALGAKLPILADEHR